jgi:hypothetical protein
MWMLGLTTSACGLTCYTGGRPHSLAGGRPLHDVLLVSDERADEDAGPRGVTIPPAPLLIPALRSSV